MTWFLSLQPSTISRHHHPKDARLFTRSSSPLSDFAPIFRELSHSRLMSCKIFFSPRFKVCHFCGCDIWLNVHSTSNNFFVRCSWHKLQRSFNDNTAISRTKQLSMPVKWLMKSLGKWERPRTFLTRCNTSNFATTKLQALRGKKINSVSHHKETKLCCPEQLLLRLKPFVSFVA